MDKHIKKITDEFTKQAKTFNEYQKNFSNRDLVNFALDNMKLNGSKTVLEVAAGTCGFGRSVAPQVRYVTEFDVTSAMLNVGKLEAEKQQINNVSFVVGEAEKLPFLDNSYDVVMSRLAFHHFKDPKIVTEEMVRVLRSNGKLVIIDMEARAKELRHVADYYETLRDVSHTKCLSKEEFLNLGEYFNLNLEFCETVGAPVKLNSWLDLTGVKEPIRTNIIEAMTTDINGGEKTGFSPYLKDGELYFNHKWLLVIFKK